MDLILDTHAFLWFISGDSQLPVSFEHTKKLLKLPHHHSDPFDRMIISQSLVEKMPIISKDRFFKDYNIKVIW